MPDTSDAPEHGHGTDGDAVPDGSLTDLLRCNGEWTSVLPDDSFENARETQSPWTVSVCCSDSRVS